MNSIADILTQNKMILDAIEILVNKYIGAQLFHKCGIVKVVDKFLYSGSSHISCPLSEF